MELTEQQKAESQLMAASERISVEHSLASLKRHRILSDRLHLHTSIYMIRLWAFVWVYGTVISLIFLDATGLLK